MDLGLRGRVALVLGASGGLGRAVATALAAEGARVACAGRSGDRVQATVEAIRHAGGSAMGAAFELADLEAGRARLREVQEVWGPVAVLVNNTGGPPPAAALSTDAATWRAHFESMFLSVVELTAAVLPGMRAERWGRVVTSTSSGVIAPIPDLAISNSLRAAVTGWSKTLAAEVASDGVTVNMVVPGRIATGRTEAIDAARAARSGADRSRVEEASRRGIPAGRYGRPDEFGAAVAFLASEPASYITGATLRVDGGLLRSI